MTTRRSFDWSAIAQKVVDGDKKKTYDTDEGFFNLKFADDGTFNAIVRFLPPNIDEDLPFQKVYNHGWKGDAGGWFIENCPTTIGNKCPVCSDNGKIYESNPELAKKRKRKLSFYANILIVKNPQQPDTEGKVFKFRYGAKIHEKIMEKIAPKNPEIDDMVPIFDYEKGANFKLKAKQTTIAGFSKPVPNYDSSSFAEPTAIALNGKPLTDSQLDDLDKQIHKLNYLVDPKLYKSFDQLCAIYEDKMGSKISNESVKKSVELSNDTETRVQHTVNPVQPTITKTTVQTVAASEDDDGESDEDFFARLKQG